MLNHEGQYFHLNGSGGGNIEYVHGKKHETVDSSLSKLKTMIIAGAESKEVVTARDELKSLIFALNSSSLLTAGNYRDHVTRNIVRANAFLPENLKLLPSFWSAPAI